MKLLTYQFSIQKKRYSGDNFTPIPRKRLQGQHMLLGIKLIELTEPSDTLNYKQCSNIAF